MKRAAGMLIILCLALAANGQEQEKEKLFTIGISEGIGGTHWLLSPALDLTFSRFRLQFSSIPPYPRFLSAGAAADLKKSKNNRLTWIASVNYWQAGSYYWTRIIDGQDYNNISILSGLKVALSGSLRLIIQAGGSVMGRFGGFTGIEDHSLLPYGELSLSLDMIRFYKKNKK